MRVGSVREIKNKEFRVAMAFDDVQLDAPAKPISLAGKDAQIYTARQTSGVSAESLSTNTRSGKKAVLCARLPQSIVSKQFK